MTPVTQIVRDAKIAMRINPIPHPSIAGLPTPQLTIDDIIVARIAQAVRQAHMEAGIADFDKASSFSADVAWRDGNVAIVALPADFLRLVAFKMSDWERPVASVIDAGDDRYALQSSRYAGLRGNPQRPVCALAHTADGLALECYGSVSREATIDTALYIPEPRIIDDAICIAPAAYHRVIEILSAAAARPAAAL